MLLISYLLLFLASVLAIPAAVFCCEIIAAIISLRRGIPTPPRNEFRPRIAVLVPAHNESKGLLPTLADVQQQLRPGDRVLVVADNCTDDTASVALAAGAEVIERRDPTRRGKGYALAFGIDHLQANPVDAVIMIDADCRLAPDTIDHLGSSCAATRRPVQVPYLMTAPAGSPINYQVAEFAWRAKNWLRPLGLSALGMPCQLMGTGTAIPWELIHSADLAHGSIVEDLKLGLDLAMAGHPPVFCPSTRVMSEFAASDTGAKAQRSRWEQGHIYTIVTEAPRLLWRAVTRRDAALLALALDLSVPPLSLLAMLVGSLLLATLLAALLHLSLVPAAISLASFVALLFATILAWLYCGRDVLPGRAVLSIPMYAFRKLGLYRDLMSGRMDTQWVRTDRKKPSEEI